MTPSNTLRHSPPSQSYECEMTRFIALVWDDRDVDSVRYALSTRQRVMDSYGWTTATDGAGLTIFVYQTVDAVLHKPVPLSGGAGIILGTLFNRSAMTHSAQRKLTIGEKQTADILRSRGRSLIESGWGSYILFLRRPLDHAVIVFRGPAGFLPCYYRALNRCTLLVSCTVDLRWLCGASFSINWDSIRAQAAAGDYLTRETGLTEVAELISGECLAIQDGRNTSELYWHPARLGAIPVRHFSEAVGILRLETRRCVRAWADLHETILLLLSGGLDSSIVLSCLRDRSAHTRVIAVNFFSDGPGDERRFARSMAEMTHTVLEEIPHNRNIDLHGCLQCALTPSPVLNFSAFDVEPVVQQLAHRRHATAIFTGETGDDLFGHAPAPEALSEILQASVPIRRFIAASMDYAELTRISVWRAMRLAIQYPRWLRRIGHWSVYHHRRLFGLDHENHLISEDAAQTYEGMISRFTHPWHQEADGLLHGKAMLIHSFVKATSSGCLSPFSATGEAVTMSPLVSQPLFEAALRIPADMHFSRAQNGAVAREAFGPALSAAVLDRGIAKGTPTVWVRRLLEGNAPFLRELLLDGMLMHQGILDRRKVEAVLSRDISRTRVGIADLIRQIYIEAWIRRWARAGARV